MLKIVDVSRDGNEIVIDLITDEKTERAKQIRLTETAAERLISKLIEAIGD